MIRRFARPRTRPEPGTMNKLETQYAQHLELRKRAGEIVDYRFERMRLKLAGNTFYTPDFMVTTLDRIEMHETKGFWEDDARVKIKVAADQFPEFLFVAVQWKQKTWVFEEF